MIFDEDSMPVVCDCGEWFDLSDGYPDRDSNKVICKTCHLVQKQEEELADDLYELASALDNGDVSFNGARGQLKALGITKSFKTKQALISWAMNYRYED